MNAYYRFLDRLTADLLENYGKTEHIAAVQQYLKAQVAAMPDFLRWGVMSVTMTFNAAFFLVALRPFSQATGDLKRRTISFITRHKLPFLFDLVRFYRSFIVFKTLELEERSGKI